jgi:hypothetical protein
MSPVRRPRRGSRPRVALATSTDWPDLAPDDRLIAPALARFGIDTEIAIWTEDGCDWERFDAILVRSCWNYHDDLPRWLDWIATIERRSSASLSGSDSPAPPRPLLLNSPSVLRWNARKTYLTDLAARGVSIVPTRWLDQADLASWTALEAALQACGWEDLILKPAVSAGALLTYRVQRRDLSASRAVLTGALPELARRGPVLIQPYLGEIANEGEWSLLFFDGQPSHAVSKRPAAGDFRVQEKHGGTTFAATPPSEMVTFAQHVLAAAVAATAPAATPPQPFIYARVDLVVSAGQPLLMELELTEPALFLQTGPVSPRGESGPDTESRPREESPADRLAAAVARRFEAAEPLKKVGRSK